MKSHADDLPKPVEKDRVLGARGHSMVALMIIRSEQLSALDEALQERYYEDLRKLLRQRFPQLVDRLDDPALLERIASGVRSVAPSGFDPAKAFWDMWAFRWRRGPRLIRIPRYGIFSKCRAIARIRRSDGCSIKSYTSCNKYPTTI